MRDAALLALAARYDETRALALRAAAEGGASGRGVGWLHIPKCGTAFGVALYHYACPAIPANATTLPCGSKLPNAAKPNCRIRSETVPYANSEGRRPLRQGYPVGRIHRDLVDGYPMARWCPRARFANVKGDHTPYILLRRKARHEGNAGVAWATMLRRPKQRLLSAYGAGLHAMRMSKDYAFAMYALVETPLMFARVGGVAGCQTKSLLDKHCHRAGVRPFAGTDSLPRF